MGGFEECVGRLGIEMTFGVNERKLECACVCRSAVNQTTFRYEQSRVVEVGEGVVVVVFSVSFLVAFLADDQRGEGAIHRVV